MRRTPAPPSDELVPLAERFRYMLAFRVLAAAGVAGAVLLGRGSLLAPAASIAASTAAFLLLAFAAHGLWRASRTRGTALFGLMLIADGAFLAWAAYATGGSGSPVGYLIVLELLAVSLLASYRTGIKVALWQSLLVVAVYYARKGGMLAPLDADHRTNLIGSPWEQTVVYVVVLWVMTIATACFSAVNERELRRRRTDLEALADLTVRLDRESQPSGVAAALIGSVVDTFGFARAVAVGFPDGQRPEALAAHGAATVAAAPDPRIAAGSVLEAAARTRRTQLVFALDPEADPWLAALLPGARNLVVLPLAADGGTGGALVVEHDSRLGSRIERRLVAGVERFAAHGALALRNAWLLEEMQLLAATDPLTGLANRMTFADALERELARAARDGGEVSLVLLDLDHFKGLNDTRGHQAGDEVLRRTAAVLREQQRAYDTAARYGGEEFALIAPGLTAADAVPAAERIRAAIAAGNAVTASLGVATFPGDAGDANALVAAADRALYRSKDSGRDRVTPAGAPGTALAQG